MRLGWLTGVTASLVGIVLLVADSARQRIPGRLESETARGGDCQKLQNFSCPAFGKLYGGKSCDEKCDVSCSGKPCTPNEDSGGCAGADCGKCLDSLLPNHPVAVETGESGNTQFAYIVRKCSPSNAACESTRCCARAADNPDACADCPTSSCSCSCDCINPFDCDDRPISPCGTCTGIFSDYYATGDSCTG